MNSELTSVENTSGQGSSAAVPAEVDRWNWGAFLLNWIWGVGNNTFVALLMWVPLVNFVMIFVLGAKGSAWAWQNKRWESVDQFHAVQRRWTKWGIVLWMLVPLFVGGLFFAVTSMLKDSEAFKLAVARLNTNAQVMQMVGQPFSTGMPMGQIEVSGPRGSAGLSFSIEGPRGKATVYVEAKKDLGEWKIDRMAVENDEDHRRVDLAP